MRLSEGVPANPMSDADVEAKFRSCCAELLLRNNATGRWNCSGLWRPSPT